MNIEQDIKNSLHKKTLSREAKQNMWNAIEKEISTKKKRKPVFLLTSAAAAFAILFGSQTNIGQAGFSSIKDIFVPEKTVDISIEGTNEQTSSTLVADESSKYVLYIDEERYVSNKKDGATVITPKTPLGEGYPEVSMTIAEEANASPEETLESIKNNLMDAPNVLVDKVSEPLDATLVSVIEGNKWNSPVEKYYVFSNGKNGSFIVKQSYFLEASEGHGARMNEMLKEFKILK